MLSVSLSRSLLFDITMHTINHNINALKPTISDDSIISHEDEQWFDRSLSHANNIVSHSISHLLCLDKQTSNYNNDFIVYNLELTHPLQEFYIADSIEQALVALVCKQWYDLKCIPLDTKEIGFLEKLKSLSLMIEPKVKRRYSIV